MSASDVDAVVAVASPARVVPAVAATSTDPAPGAASSSPDDVGSEEGELEGAGEIAPRSGGGAATEGAREAAGGRAA
ncbi:MAG TPA: hypothetical protein VEC15_12700, partial [Actinomycetota bacterium]|nr:hypothetical protein [Actinomycetota bacterium]